MNLAILIPWSDVVEERRFDFPDWSLPIPRKGEAIQLFATYTGERIGGKHILRDGKCLCIFHVERVTYHPDAHLVELRVSFTVPCLTD